MAARKSQKTLVIVESGAKAATLRKFLGRGYNVMASVGHVRDLPKSGLGVDVENDFAPKYVVPRDKSKVVTTIRKAAQGAKEVMLATDPDREGEAIAWHLRSAAKLDGRPVKRVAFHEITKAAVTDAIRTHRQIDQDLVDAQQARRVLDRLVGYRISPLLNRRVRRGTSAGRVQSVALRLVVERDREIEAFEPREYWTLDGLFARAGTESPTVRGKLEAVDGELDLSAQEAVETLSAALLAADYRVEARRAGEITRRPSPPFTTSTLQQAASARLGMSPRRTMAIAQQLYEGVDTGSGPVGLITYMRTDSTSVSQEAQAAARRWIGSQFSAEYLPSRAPTYRSRVKNAQEAHEAIRPTGVERTPEAVRERLNADQLRLYDLIWRRFVASQMSPARQRRVTAPIRPSRDGEDLAYRFNATATVTTFPGFRAVLRPDQTDAPEVTAAAELIDSLAKDDSMALVTLDPEQHFTEPPPRYSEATLVRALEEAGIGRPSTYAPTVATLLERGYAELTRRRLESTELGRTVADLLIQHFPTIMDYGFTAQMEEKLDSVSRGELGWVPLLREFYGPFAETLEAAEQTLHVTPEPVGRDCPECGQPLVHKRGRFGPFIGCSGFPECRYIERVERPPPEPAGRDCPQCGQPLVHKEGRFGRFIGCSGFPKCRYIERVIVGTGVTCPTCGEGEVVEKRTRRGRLFWGCSRYPECDYATWSQPSGGREAARNGGSAGKRDKAPSGGAAPVE